MVKGTWRGGDGGQAKFPSLAAAQERVKMAKVPAERKPLMYVRDERQGGDFEWYSMQPDSFYAWLVSTSQGTNIPVREAKGARKISINSLPGLMHRRGRAVGINDNWTTEWFERAAIQLKETGLIESDINQWYESWMSEQTAWMETTPKANPEQEETFAGKPIYDRRVEDEDIAKRMKREGIRDYEIKDMVRKVFSIRKPGSYYYEWDSVIWKDGVPVGHITYRRDGKTKFYREADRMFLPHEHPDLADQENPSRAKACPVLGRVDQLAGEIIDLAYNHPVAAAFSAIHDAGQMNRGHPVFDYSVMIVDSIDEAMKTLKRFRSGELSEKTALAVLERRLTRLTAPVPEQVLQAMEGYVLKPDATEYLLRPTVDVLFDRIEQVVANNTRLAMYVFEEEFDDLGREVDNPIGDYLFSLDAQVADAEASRAKLRAKEVEETEVILELMQIRLLVMAPTAEIKVKIGEGADARPEAIFSAYNELSTVAELSAASRHVRSGTGTSQEREVADYLDSLVRQAGEIKEMFRERMCGFDIALIALREMVTNARKIAPDAGGAGAKLAKPFSLPKIFAPGALDELEKIEGSEWRARQESHQEDPKGFYANLTPAAVIRDMTKAAEDAVKAAKDALEARRGTKEQLEQARSYLEAVEKMMVPGLVPGTGIIEGRINDYLVANDGKLTKRRRKK